MQEVSFFTFVRITQHFKKCFLGALKKKFGFAGRKRGPDELFEIALHTRPFPLLFFGLAAATSVADRPRGCGNDPSAGSPTETLLRLHLPLNDSV